MFSFGRFVGNWLRKPAMAPISWLFTKDVPRIIASIEKCEILDARIDPHLPLSWIKFKDGQYEYEVRLQSLNGMDGVEEGSEYDTGVDWVTISSRWKITDASLEELNEWNRRYRESYAIKVDEFVEIVCRRGLILMDSCKESVVRDAVIATIHDSADFVDYMTSRR